MSEDFPFDYPPHPNPQKSAEETKLSLWYLERLRGNDSERVGNIQRAGRVYKNVRMQLQADDLHVPIKGRIELESFCGGKRVTGEGSSLWLQPHGSGPDGDADDRLTVLDFQLSPERRVFSFYLRCNYSPTSRKKKRPEFRVSIYIGPFLVVDWKVSVFHSSSVTRVLKSLQNVPARCCLLYHDLLTSKWTRYTQPCDSLHLLPAYPNTWDHDELSHLSHIPPSSSSSPPPSSTGSSASLSPPHSSMSHTSPSPFQYHPLHSAPPHALLPSSYPSSASGSYFNPPSYYHQQQQQHYQPPPSSSSSSSSPFGGGSGGVPTFVYKTSPPSSRNRAPPVSLPSISSSIFSAPHHLHQHHHSPSSSHSSMALGGGGVPVSPFSSGHRLHPLFDPSSQDIKPLPSLDAMLLASSSPRGPRRLPSMSSSSALSSSSGSPTSSSSASLLTHMSNLRARSLSANEPRSLSSSIPPTATATSPTSSTSSSSSTKKDNEEKYNCGLDALILCLAPYTEA